MLLVTATGCAKVTTVPPSGYRDPQGGLSRYRVHLTSGVTYYVTDFTADDSTLTVLRFRHLHNEEIPPPPAPFTLPLADVKSVEMISPSDETPLILGGIFLIFIGLAAYASGLGCPGCN